MFNSRQKFSPAMNADGFAWFVELVEPVAYNDGDLYSTIQDHAWQVLNWFDCPVEWRWPVWVMAKGLSYYGADGWTKNKQDIDHFIDD